MSNNLTYEDLTAMDYSIEHDITKVQLNDMKPLTEDTPLDETIFEPASNKTFKIEDKYVLKWRNARLAKFDEESDLIEFVNTHVKPRKPQAKTGVNDLTQKNEANFIQSQLLDTTYNKFHLDNLLRYVIFDINKLLNYIEFDAEARLGKRTIGLLNNLYQLDSRIKYVVIDQSDENRMIPLTKDHAKREFNIAASDFPDVQAPIIDINSYAFVANKWCKGGYPTEPATTTEYQILIRSKKTRKQ